MIGEPSGLRHCPWEGAFSSVIEATPETRLINWLYDEAQTMRVMPSDEEKEGLSPVSQVPQRIESSFSSI